MSVNRKDEHAIGYSLAWYRGKNDWLFLGNVQNDNVAKLKLASIPYIVGSPDGRGNESAIVLIGDSHALHYFYTLGNYVQNNPGKFDKTSVYLKNGGLASLKLEELSLPKNTRRVVLSYFWAFHLNNEKFNTYIRCYGNGPGGVAGIEFSAIDNAELKQNKIDVMLVLENPFGEELNAKSLLNVRRNSGVSLEAKNDTFDELAPSKALQIREPTASRLLEISQDLDLGIIDPFEF